MTTISQGLNSKRYEVMGITEPIHFELQLDRFRPHVLLLDRNMPLLSGEEILIQIRRSSKWNRLPTILLSGYTGVDERVKGLSLGADDYLEKPFSVKELEARIESQLRRVESDYLDDYLQLYLHERRLVVQGKPISLSLPEWNALQFLAREKGVHSRNRIGQAIWGADGDFSFRSVDMVILRLRKKIEKSSARPRYIVSDYGNGYLWAPGIFG